MPVSIRCVQCGAPWEVPPSRRKRSRFCTRRCYAAWLSENRSGENHHMHGKRHSAAAIEKMSKAQRARGLVGPKASTWKGGRFKSRGYTMLAASALSAEALLLAAPMIAAGRAYVPEHRLVMARRLGRPLRSTEIVHHLNGRKSDNRPENLELTDAAEHKRDHSTVVEALRAAKAEIDDLRSALQNRMCLKCGASTSSNPGE